MTEIESNPGSVGPRPSRTRARSGLDRFVPGPLGLAPLRLAPLGLGPPTRDFFGLSIDIFFKWFIYENINKI